MKINAGYRLAVLWAAEPWSPLGLVRRAFVLGLVYLAVRLAGLQQFATVLNGTMGSVRLGAELSAALGAIFILAYLAFVLLSPVLLIAAAILALCRRLPTSAPRPPVP